MEIDIISRLELAIANESHPRKRNEMRLVLADTLKRIEARVK